MSAALDNVKKGWLTLVLSFLLTIVTVMITQAMTNRYDIDKSTKEEIQSKAPLEYVDIRFRTHEERLEKAASVEYVENRIEQHEKRDDARYQGLIDLVNIQNTRLIEIHADIRAMRSSK
jgi:hypothetical protein